MKRFAISIFAIAALINPINGQEEKGTDKAKKIVSQFTTKFAANDIDATMKLADVPFVHNFNDPQKNEVIRDRDALKKLLQKILESAQGKKIQFEVADVITHAKLLEIEGDKISKEDRKLLDEIVGKEGYFLKVDVKDDQGKMINRLKIIVGSRGKELKVVGWKG